MFLDQSKRVYKKKVTAKGKENKYLVKKLDTSNNMLSTDNDQIRENTSMSNNNIDDNYEYENICSPETSNDEKDYFESSGIESPNFMRKWKYSLSDYTTEDTVITVDDNDDDDEDYDVNGNNDEDLPEICAENCLPGTSKQSPKFMRRKNPSLPSYVDNLFNYDDFPEIPANNYLKSLGIESPKLVRHWNPSLPRYNVDNTIMDASAEISAENCLPGTSKQNPKFIGQSSSSSLHYNLDNMNFTRSLFEPLDLSINKQLNPKTNTKNNLPLSEHTLIAAEEQPVTINSKMQTESLLMSKKVITTSSDLESIVYEQLFKYYNSSAGESQSHSTLTKLSKMISGTLPIYQKENKEKEKK